MKKVLLFGFILSMVLSLTVSAQSVDYLIIKQHLPSGQQDTVMMNMSSLSNDTAKLTVQNYDMVNLADYGDPKQLMLRAYDSACISDKDRMMVQTQLSSKMHYFFSPWPHQQEITRTKQLWAKGEGQTIAFWERIKSSKEPAQVYWLEIIGWFLLLAGIAGLIICIYRDKNIVMIIIAAIVVVDALVAKSVMSDNIVGSFALSFDSLNGIIFFSAVSAVIAALGVQKHWLKIILTAISIILLIIFWIVIFLE